MAYSAGTAYVQVLPSLRGIGGSIRSQLNSQLRGVGETAGTQIGRELGGGADTGLRSSLGRITTTVGRLAGTASTALTRVVPGLDRFRRGFVDADYAASAVSGRLGSLGGIVGKAARTAGSAFQTIGRAGISVASTLGSSFIDFSNRAAASVQSKLSAAFQKVKGIGMAALGALGVAGIGSLISSGLQRISDIEQTTKALTVLTGSAAKAQSTMDDLLTFAKTTPFAFPDIAAIGKNLIAFGVDTRKVIPALKAMGDAASASGRGAEGLANLGDVIGSIAAKGKIQGDELLRLSEQGVPALQILANTARVSAAEMRDRISAGAVDSTFAIDALIEGIENGTTGIAGNTAKFGGIMEQQKDTIVGTMDSFRSSITSTMATLLTPYVPAFRASVSAIGNGFKALPDLLAQAKQAMDRIGITDAIGGLIDGIKNLVSAAAPLIRDFAIGFAAAFGAGITVLIRAVGAALSFVGDTLRRFQPILQPLVIGLGAMWGLQVALRAATYTWGAAVLVLKGVISGLSVVTKAWTIVTWALNAAWAASPIGLVIVLLAGLVAGIVYAWNHFEGFRNVVLTVWRAIQTAISFAWNSILKPAFNGIVTALQAVGSFFRWLWVTIIQPIAKLIYTVIAITAAVFLTILVAPVVLALKLLGAIVTWLWNVAIGPAFRGIAWLATWLWHNAIQPALNGIGVAFTAVWQYVIQPVVNAIRTGLRWIGDRAIWLWHNAIQPAWNGISAVVSGAYHGVIQPIFNALRTALQAVGTAFNWVYTTLIKPAWDAMGRAVRAVYDNVLRPAFEAIKTAVNAVGTAFSAVVDGIKIVWDKIKGICAAPINFVIDVIWNKGIRAAWNAIVGWIPGLDLTLGPLKTISFARGGVLPGYAPGQDTVRALLSPGEAVLVPEAVRMLGPENILALNAYARGQRSDGSAGPVFGRDGTPQFFLGGIWEGIKSIGRGIANVAEAVAGAVVDAATFIAHFTTDPLGTLTSMVPGLDGLKKWASKGWGKAITQLPGSIFGGLISSIKRALGFEDDGQGGPPPEQAPIQKMQAFANQQKGKTYLWGATGPAHWDCSGLVGALWATAQGKDPYRRYMTTAGMGAGKFGMKAGKGPFTIYLGPGHTAANINGLHAEAYGGDGVPLAIGRVGTPLSFYNQILHYATGGLVRLPRGRREQWESFLVRGWPEPPVRYDSGGQVPPGYSTIYNGTRRPEALLTNAQWDAVATAARSDGGEFTGTLVLDSGELLGVVRGEIHRANEQTGLAIARRTR